MGYVEDIHIFDRSEQALQKAKIRFKPLRRIVAESGDYNSLACRVMLVVFQPIVVGT